ncbi:hypothetical protein EV421DRAFT_1075724 [Armillaria borealis]|uniref:Uncharacterized protein n=1 Tax=Armillaria borealis TaxID=47425 RepID=A0AA39J7M7_9AGAR|nr:hypothetical protein EV421DRAFT_1075724 [Armillaria borealis]
MQYQFHIEISSASQEMEAALHVIEHQENTQSTAAAFYEHEHSQSHGLSYRFPANDEREVQETIPRRGAHRRSGASNLGHWWDGVAILNASQNIRRNELKWNRTCRYCGIKVLMNERTHNDCFVCGPHGSHVLPCFPPYPDEWQVFLSHRQLRASSRHFNSLFSLTVLGVYDGDFMHFKTGVAAVTLNGGRTYHCLIPAQEGQHAI